MESRATPWGKVNSKRGAEVAFKMPETRPLVGVIVGSRSDWQTLCHSAEILTRFDVPHECRIVSAHRTPVLMAE